MTRSMRTLGGDACGGGRKEDVHACVRAFVCVCVCVRIWGEGVGEVGCGVDEGHHSLCQDLGPP